MAKAKKSESSSKPEASAAPKAKKPPAAAKKTAKAASSSPAGSPMVDTNLAAQAAARMLVAGFSKSAGANAPRQESAMFKQMKAGLNKPTSSTVSNLLDKSAGPEPTKSHAGFNKQVGQNQTFGADVTRSGVPRRTPG